MKTKSFFAALLALSFAAGINAAEYQIDSGHAFAIFKVNHINFADSYGRFNDISGSLDLEKGEINVTIQTGSIDTASEKRDKHLKSPDFFNANQFPTITFKSTNIKSVGGNDLEITGDLTMLGQTKSITVKATKTGEGQDPWKNQRIGMETTFTINRHDFGMDYMKGGIGADVTIMLSIEGVVPK